MLAFTCPKCQQITTAAIQSDKCLSCPGCDQRLQVVVADADAAAGRRGGPSLLFIGFCGLGGLGVSALMVLVWFFAGRNPAPPRDDRVAQDASERQIPASAPTRAASGRCRVASPLPGMVSRRSGMTSRRSRTAGKRKKTLEKRRSQSSSQGCLPA